MVDLERWTAMSGEGHVELIDPQGNQQWSRRLRFEMAGFKLVAVLDQAQGTRNGRPISNRLVVTSDGRSITNGINQTEIDKNEFVFASVSEGCRIDPRWFILPPVMRTFNELAQLERTAKSVRLVDSATGTIRVDVEFPNAMVNRYWFSPDLDHRMVRVELLSETRLCWVYEYEWQLIGGRVCPNVAIVQIRDSQARQGMFTHRLNLTSIQPIINRPAGNDANDGHVAPPLEKSCSDKVKFGPRIVLMAERTSVPEA